MDAQVVFAVVGLGFTLGTGLVAVTVHATKTRDIADGAAHRARNVEQAQISAAAKADATFARQDVLNERFSKIEGSLDEIKDTLKAMRGGMGV